MLGPEEMSSSYARVKSYEEGIGIEDAAEGDIAPTEQIFDAARDIPENIYDDNPAPSGDRDSGGDSGPLTCLVCR